MEIFISGNDILYSDFSVIEGLVEVYSVKTDEFLEIFFGKCGTHENHLEKVWSFGDSCRIHEVVEIISDGRVSGHQTSTNLKIEKEHAILGKKNSKTIAIDGEYTSEKCELLGRLCQKFTVGDCSLTVNSDSKVVTVAGKDIGKFQECVNMIELQMKLFHYEEITNLSKKLFNLAQQNKMIKKYFFDLLDENQLDSIVLFEDNLNRPAVLGLNKIKTRNFIEWLGKFLTKVGPVILYNNC